MRILSKLLVIHQSNIDKWNYNKLNLLNSYQSLSFSWNKIRARGNVSSGKYPFGNLSIWGTVRQENICRGNVFGNCWGKVRRGIARITKIARCFLLVILKMNYILNLKYRKLYENECGWGVRGRGRSLNHQGNINTSD